MEIIKSSSNYTIVDSGTLFNFEKDDTILISYEFDNEFRFKVEFSFSTEKGQKRSLKIDVLEQDQTIKINCINFEPLGTGTKRPIELASHNGKKIFIHFWVYLMGNENESIRKVDYCLYQEN